MSVYVTNYLSKGDNTMSDLTTKDFNLMKDLILDDCATIKALMAENIEEFSNEELELLEDFKVENTDALSEYLENIGQISARKAEELEKLKQEFDALKAKKDEITELVDSLRAGTKEILTKLNLDKVASKNFLFSTKKGNPKVIVTDADSVPEKFQKIKITFDLNAIKSALKAVDSSGEEIKYAKLEDSVALTITSLASKSLHD